MRPWTWTIAAAGLLLTALPCPARACSICINVKQSLTIRQQAARPTARLVLLGTMTNARLDGNRTGAGKTDFRIEAVLKSDPRLPAGHAKKRGDTIVLPLYLPSADPDKPLRYLIFCDVVKDRYDPYHGLPMTSGDAAAYLRGALALDRADVKRSLLYFFRYLDHADKEIARDAFMEFVKASDQEVGEIGKLLPAAKLRAWLKDPKTPRQRLGLYAFLLGACGGDQDVQWFRSTLEKPGDRLSGAFDGLLGGYIQLRPAEGWKMAARVLGDPKQPLTVRLTAVRTLHFYHGWRGKGAAPAIRTALAAMLRQGELADVAVERLRQWKMWELTRDVLAQYGRKGLDAPIHQRAIVRYALCCPRPEAKTFVAQLRRRESELVTQVEESLQYEKR